MSPARVENCRHDAKDRNSPQVKARERQCQSLLHLRYGPPIAEGTEMDSE